MTKKYDYIIVGAGSAGCVLASRLSEDKNNSVLLIESGGSDKNIFIKMPTALSYPMNTKKYAWQFHTVAEEYLDNRVMHCPRGKVLGGSSSINGMVFVRGHKKDFDEWQEHGAKGWNYDNCLPYFKKMESYYAGGNDYRGANGPISITNGNNMFNPLYMAFIDAGVQAGYSKKPPLNHIFRQCKAANCFRLVASSDEMYESLAGPAHNNTDEEVVLLVKVPEEIEFEP